MIAKWVTRVLKVILGIFIAVVVIGAVGEGVHAAVELAGAVAVWLANDHVLAGGGCAGSVPAALWQVRWTRVRPSPFSPPLGGTLGAHDS